MFNVLIKTTKEKFVVYDVKSVIRTGATDGVLFFVFYNHEWKYIDSALFEECAT